MTMFLPRLTAKFDFIIAQHTARINKCDIKTVFGLL